MFWRSESAMAVSGTTTPFTPGFLNTTFQKSTGKADVGISNNGDWISKWMALFLKYLLLVNLMRAFLQANPFLNSY